MSNVRNIRTNDTDVAVKMAEFGRDLSYIKSSVDDIKNSIDSDYVSKDEFEPIKKIVYGLVGLILIAVVGALMTLVIQNAGK